MNQIDNFIKKHLPMNRLEKTDIITEKKPSVKPIMFILSSAYLVLTFTLFLSDASINMLLLYAIFTYILYVPLVGIFTRPDQFYIFSKDDAHNQHEYLLYVGIFMMFVGILLLFTNIIHPKSLLTIAQAFLDGIPHFKLGQFLADLFKGLPWYSYIIIALTAIYLWYIYLAILAALVLFWLLSFLLNFVVNIIVFVAFIALILGFFYQIWKTAYRGYKNSRQYVQGNFRLALYISSTVITGIYVFILMFANLIIMH